jgi:simple sugar transport system ATP-binding protein
VDKRYGPTLAVSGASLDLTTGKIHAIVGENGAGKSTLSSIATGLVRPDAGHVEVFGERLSPHTAHAAIARGVGIVQQHFRLIDALSVLDNAMLGVEPVRSFGRIDREGARVKLERVFAQLRAKLDPNACVSTLGVGDRQRLEIARVLFCEARVIVLDEPTAVLTLEDANALYVTLRRLADDGRAIAVVTHKIDEVLDHADEVTVMRRGRVVSTREVDRTSNREAQRRALLHDAFHDSDEASSVALPGAGEGDSQVLLEIDGLEAGALRGARLQVRAREIVGLAGVDGNGQRELVDVLAGLREPSKGAVLAHAPIEIVHDDRQRRGLVLAASVADNAVLGELGRFSRAIGLDVRAMRDEAHRRVQDGGVTPSSIDLPASALSGGNQQKLLIARALARGDAGRRILVLAQPTRGVDINAARQIHRRIVEAAESGAAVLVLSADLDELRALCHRIVVMAHGRMVGEARRDTHGQWDESATNEKLGARMVARVGEGLR